LSYISKAIFNKHFFITIIKGGEGTDLTYTVPEVKPPSSEEMHDESVVVNP